MDKDGQQPPRLELKAKHHWCAHVETVLSFCPCKAIHTSLEFCRSQSDSNRGRWKVMDGK